MDDARTHGKKRESMKDFGGAWKMQITLKLHEQNVNMHLEGIEGGRRCGFVWNEIEVAFVCDH